MNLVATPTLGITETSLECFVAPPPETVISYIDLVLRPELMQEHAEQKKQMIAAGFTVWETYDDCRREFRATFVCQS